MAGNRDADEDAHPQRRRGRAGLQELPTAPPTTERQVSAAADIGSQNLNGSSQSEVDVRHDPTERQQVAELTYGAESAAVRSGAPPAHRQSRHL